MNDRITALEEALRSTLNFIENTEGELGIILGCGDKARAALAASRAATDCHQPDLVTADRALVKPLVWHENPDIGEGGYIAKGIFGVAYHAMEDGWSYYRQGLWAYASGLYAAKAAAQADYEARILAALDLTPAPAVEPVATNTMVQPAATPQECATEGCGKLATVHFIRRNIGSYYCMDCYLRVHKQTHPALRAIGGDA